MCIRDSCYWDARNLVDVVILLCYLSISVCVLTITLCRFNKINRYGESGRRIARIYMLIILWSVTFSFQMLLGSSIYLTVVNNNSKSVNMESYSRIYARIDVIPAFVITTIFLSICKIFFNGLVSSIRISLMMTW